MLRKFLVVLRYGPDERYVMADTLSGYIDHQTAAENFMRLWLKVPAVPLSEAGEHLIEGLLVRRWSAAVPACAGTLTIDEVIEEDSNAFLTIPASTPRHRSIAWPTDILSTLTALVFDHQADFIATFFDDFNADNVIEVRFGPERCSVVLLLECGQHVSTSVESAPVRAWMETVS